MEPRRILAVGAGVGIEIGVEDLRVVAARVRPAGTSVLGSTVLADFRRRPAGEWGGEYGEFVKRLGAGHLAATAILPRHEVIVRHLMLPGVANRDVASAIQYQIDSLHPYGEEEARYAWVRLGKTPAILIGISREAVIQRYAELFAEAGIKLASLTFSAAVLYPALRLLSAPPEGGFLAVTGSNGDLELYGESAARPVFSAVLDGPRERAASLAAAELRLEPDAQPVALADLLPSPRKAPAEHDSSRAALPYAAAMAGACPRLAPAANLLPPELRSSGSRAMYVPTVALAGLLLVLLAAMVAQAKLQERWHLAALQAEIAKLEPQASRIQALEQAAQQAQARIRLIDDFRRRTQADLDALNQLTQLLQPPAWLSGLDLDRGSATLAGEAEQAAPLLKLLDSSPHFQGSQFTIPIARAGQKEAFRIRAAREGVPQ